MGDFDFRVQLLMGVSAQQNSDHIHHWCADLLSPESSTLRENFGLKSIRAAPLWWMD
jgi:hypothetical protein